MWRDKVMKKIYVGRILINFLWMHAFFVAIFSIFRAIFIQTDMLYLLFLSAFFILLSFLCFINKIHVSKNEIKIACIINKQNYSRDELVEMYIRNDVFGFYLILNFKEQYKVPFCNEFEYAKLCKKNNNKSTCSLSCNKKDLQLLLSNFNGHIVLDKKSFVSLKKKLLSIGAKEKFFR